MRMSAERAKYILIQGVFSYSTNKRRPETLNEFLLEFLKVTVTAIVFIVPVIDY
jgi:hypothetical protein